jgi:short-subunit dehydrogenase
MRARRTGRIVNITSIGGRLAMPHLLPYAVSKFALVGLSEGLHAELAKDNVIVTTVVPGLMRTGRARFSGTELPVVSIDVDRAARKIVNALRRGDAEVVISLPAKVASLAHGIAPSLVQDVLAFVNRLLPGPATIDRRVSRAH